MEETKLKEGVIHSMINCPDEDCCGCLVGEIRETLIDFKCNECGYQAGYIDLKHLKKVLTYNKQ